MSDCVDTVLSASLKLPLSSLVRDDSEESLWYFLVSILDNACKAILVREDCRIDKVSFVFVNKNINHSLLNFCCGFLKV